MNYEDRVIEAIMSLDELEYECIVKTMTKLVNQIVIEQQEYYASEQRRKTSFDD